MRAVAYSVCSAAIVMACLSAFAVSRAYFAREEFQVMRVDEIEADTAGYPWRGNPDAALSAVVYADIESPYNRAMERMLDTFMTACGEDVILYYKLRPIRRSAQAHIRARAAYAAQRQGMFFQMKRLLDTLSLPRDERRRAAALRRGVQRCAEALPMDMARFRRDMRSGAIRRRIEGDIAETVQYGIVAYPCIILDGYLLRGIAGAGRLKRIVEHARGAPGAGSVLIGGKL